MPAPPQLDLDTHTECLGFIRSAISIADRQTAHDIAAALKDCYQNGHADRAAIWADLTSIEQQQFAELLAPPPIARDFARRIREAIGYQSPAVAGGVDEDLARAIDRGELVAADVAEVLARSELAEFDWLLGLRRA